MDQIHYVQFRIITKTSIERKRKSKENDSFLFIVEIFCHRSPKFYILLLLSCLLLCLLIAATLILTLVKPQSVVSIATSNNIINTTIKTTKSFTATSKNIR